MTDLTRRRQLLILATVCLAAFAINLDTTIVNVALPDLRRSSRGARRRRVAPAAPSIVTDGTPVALHDTLSVPYVKLNVAPLRWTKPRPPR